MDNDTDFIESITITAVTDVLPPGRSTWIEDQGYCIWLKDDPQSVPGMLRGAGDGREKHYLRFAQSWYRKDPTVTEDFIHRRYADYSEERDIKRIRTQRLRQLSAQRLIGRSDVPGWVANAIGVVNEQSDLLMTWIRKRVRRLLCLVLITYWLAMH